MLWSILILIVGISSIAATANALRPIRWDWFLLPSLVWSWVVSELPGQLILIEIVIAIALVGLGALDHVVGQIGLALLVLSWIGLTVLLGRSRGARRVVDDALSQAGTVPTSAPVSIWRILIGLPFRGRTVEKIRNVEFSRIAGRTLKLDVYRSPQPGTGRPVLLYIHGGAWVMGDKREQGLPLMHHLARNGWVCFTANYRLSPGATYPDHLVDAKAALLWVKEHAHEYGGDASFVAVSGGSAGGHIASLVALTAGDKRYQAAGADTSVQAAVPIYGITDLTNRLGAQSDRFVSMIMEPLVMKAFLDEEPDAYRAASPIDRVSGEAPAFLIIQGERDTLAPVVEARAFVERLSAVSARNVVYMEFPGAQHIFDMFYSYRSARMIEGVAAFLDHARRSNREPDLLG